MTLMGGAIGCTAAPSGGNVFWLTLPLLPEPAESRPAAHPLPRTRILLVEDSVSSRLVTTLLLRRDGHMVAGVGDGATALRELARAPYDLVLLDLHLPDIAGAELARLVRAMDGPNHATPVLGLTGDRTDTAIAACVAAGMQDVLPKGLRQPELREAIAQCVWRQSCAGAAVVLSPPTADTPVLDEGRLAELRQTVPPASLARLAQECLSTMSGLLEQLRHAEGSADQPAASAAIHAMTGLCANYGLASLGRRLRDTPDAVTINTELTRAAEALRTALRTEPA